MRKNKKPRGCGQKRSFIAKGKEASNIRGGKKNTTGRSRYSCESPDRRRVEVLAVSREKGTAFPEKKGVSGTGN